MRSLVSRLVVHLIVRREWMLRDVVNRVLHSENAAGNLILNVDDELKEETQAETRQCEQQRSHSGGRIAAALHPEIRTTVGLASFLCVCCVTSSSSIMTTSTSSKLSKPKSRNELKKGHERTQSTQESQPQNGAEGARVQGWRQTSETRYGVADVRCAILRSVHSIVALGNCPGLTPPGVPARPPTSPSHVLSA